MNDETIPSDNEEGPDINPDIWRGSTSVCNFFTFTDIIVTSWLQSIKPGDSSSELVFSITMLSFTDQTFVVWCLYRWFTPNGRFEGVLKAIPAGGLLTTCLRLIK